MGDTFKELREQLQVAGWLLPLNPERLGGGGGGNVYRCFCSDLVNGIRRGVANILQVGSASPDDAAAAMLGQLYEHLLLRADCIGVVKVPHRPDARLKREIAAMGEVKHPNLVRLLATDSKTEPGS